MKTIAITIDESTLRSVEEIAKKSPQRARNRSQIIRKAIREFVTKERQQARETREREIFKRHRRRLARQARALISEQAKP